MVVIFFKGNKMKKSVRNSLLLGVVILSAALLFNSCAKQAAQGDPAMELKLKEFIKKYEEKVKPAFRDMADAYFKASIDSKEENWKKVAQLEMNLNKIYFDKAAFKEIKEIYESNKIEDPLLKRQCKIIYNEYLGKQADTNKINKLTEMTSQIELKYSNFRAKVGNKQLTDNDVEDILKSSTNSKDLEATWTAHKQIGPLVAQDIIAIVKLRNEVAKELGFKNYHEMSLKLSDQDPEEVSKLFDELDNLTKDAFASLKKEMDDYLAKRSNIKPEELMPWHYQNRFFQEAPAIYDIDLDKYYKGKDLVVLTQNYYKSIGLPIEDMVAKSDLFEKPNKNQHAYCINVDRDNLDIRVLCNVKDNSKWMETMLHEYGHALYEKHYDKKLPFALKSPAHTFTTEAIAMIFGRKASEAKWMQENLGISAEEAAKIDPIVRKSLRLQQLCFSRWSQVMYRFEKSMYDNPDQDLNKLWWDLVEKYQMLKRPANRNMPDWATKIHIATSPCYYHNYHLGELFASQLHFTISEKVLNAKPEDLMSYTNKPEVGKFLIEKVFSVGTKYYWNEMIEKATGEKLTAKYYAKQFVN